MNYYWSMLDIAPTNDLKTIKRAYAAQLKLHRPEDNPEHFQRLREAYEWACQIGVNLDHSWDDEDEEGEDAEEDDDADDFDGEDACEHEQIIPAQAFTNLALILPSVPTHFPIDFTPPPSPNFPPLPVIEPTSVETATQLDTSPASKNVASPELLAANIAYVLPTELSNQNIRPLAQVLSAFWNASQQLKTITEIQAWLQTQPEYESLRLRPNLESALAEAFTEQTWPWPAVLGTAELLDWGTIGNLIGNELNHAVQLAHFQQRAAITHKPRWYQFSTKSAAASFLLAPFSWPQTLLSALLPRTQKIDELMDEVARTGIDPERVFNAEQVEFQRQLRTLDFNWPRLTYALMRLLGWPLLFSLLLIGADINAPLAGLVFGVAGFAMWVGFVANRLLFRRIWTPSASRINEKTFWVCWGITLAIAIVCALLGSPAVALFLTAFLLFAVARTLLIAITTGAGACFLTLIVTASIWPALANEKFATTLPITLSFITLCVYLFQRRMPADKLLSQLARAPRQQPLLATVEGINWWWLIAAATLVRIFAALH